MNTMEIKHKNTGEVLFTANVDSMAEAVKAAVKAGIDLSNANLRGADMHDAYLRYADLHGAKMSQLH